jgi:hypothetical protein
LVVPLVVGAFVIGPFVVGPFVPLDFGRSGPRLEPANAICTAAIKVATISFFIGKVSAHCSFASRRNFDCRPGANQKGE